MRFILPLTLAIICTALPKVAGERPIPINLQVSASGKHIFSGIVLTKGRDVTTATGGTHKCDGTNNGANPKPGATPTSALADAAKKVGFDFDGEWFDEFEDFFITEIGGVTCDWLVRRNGVLTDLGGCQVELDSGDHVSWAC